MLTIWYKGNEQSAEDEEDGDDSTASWSLTSYRAIILTGIISNVLACLVSLTVREIKVDAQQDDPPPSPSRTRPVNNNSNTCSSATTIDPIVVPPSPSQGAIPTKTFRPRAGSPWKILRETLALPAFRRFLLVCLITLNVRMIFRHLDATLPKCEFCMSLQGSYNSKE